MERCKVVLLVDDDSGIRETAKMVLESDHYHVITAEHGKDALAILPTLSRPAIILLDLTMPVMGGIEFLNAIEKDHTSDDIPIVVVSAVANHVKLPARVTAVIPKPYNIEKLIETVRQYCGEAPLTKDSTKEEK